MIRHNPMPEVLFTYQARLEEVQDGDTLALIIDEGFGDWKAGDDNHFRIKGVNCPEIRGPERPRGLAAKAFVQNWLDEAARSSDPWPLVIRTERLRGHQVRTFARYVAEAWRKSDGANLADAIVAAGHGVYAEG